MNTHILYKHALLLVVVLLLLSATVMSAERTDFLVNDDGGITVQNSPRVAVAGDRSFVITWVDRRNSTSDIFLQRFDRDGYALGANAKVNDDSNNSYQFEPAVGVDVSGLYSIVWKDYRNSIYPFAPDIYFQRFDSSLVADGSNVNLTTEPPDSTKETPDIALAPWGDGVVVWADYRNRNWDIYGQRISSDGSLIGTNFKINDDIGASQQHSPRVAVSPQGWFVVTWYDNRLGNDDIFIQRYNADGSKAGINVKVNADSQSARQAFPDITTDGSSHFMVVWVDWRNGVYPANPDIYSRKYDTLMTPITSEIRVNTDETSNAQREPAISADRMGNVAIVWSDSTSSSWDIMGQMIDVDGVVRETNYRANADTDSSQIDPDVALDGMYRYVVWTDNRNGNWDIYASTQKYNDPTLSVDPPALKFVMQVTGGLPVPEPIVINHVGYNPIYYTVTSNVSWLTITPADGTTPDTVSVAVNTHDLNAGTYIGMLTFTDTLNHDSSLVMSVRLDVVDSFQTSYDTLKVDDAEIQRLSSGTTSITGTMVNSVGTIFLPLQYNASLLAVDSVVAGVDVPEHCEFGFSIDDANGLLSVTWRIVSPDTAFLPGDYHLAELFITAHNTLATTPIDTVQNDTLSAYLTTGGRSLTPVFILGEITISNSTPVLDDLPAALPEEYQLGQNYPNPFNLSTCIAYTLARQSEVTLEVYNLLGQRVATLVSGSQTAGDHSAFWSGTFSDGSIAPSGVYFYRLKTPAVAITRKMVVLK